jgi:hypothetical protein
MHHMQNQHHVILYDAMNDEIAFSRERAQTRPQILVPRTAQMRIPGQQPETLGYALSTRRVAKSMLPLSRAM